MTFLTLRYEMETPSPEKALSSLILSGLPFSRARKGDGVISFCSSPFAKKLFLRWCKKEKYKPELRYEGIFAPILAIKRRYGIIFGTILSLFLIYLSTFYVWSVRIEGNSKISDGEILQLLYECGFGEGTRKSSVDVNEIQNEALLRFHELSFLSINIHGMVADVVVHERITAPKATPENIPYNLVADFDGVIVSSVVLDGKSLFEVGDTVFKGQLLVSGLVDSTSGKTDLRRSRGKVFARTNRTLTFEIPFKNIQKEYTKTEYVNGFRILGHSFFGSTDNITGDFEMQVSEEEVELFGLVLPIKKEIKCIKYYTEEKVTLSPEEAEEKAREEYRSYISTELDSATILEENFSVSENETSLILTAEVTAIENIASEKKIEVTE